MISDLDQPVFYNLLTLLSLTLLLTGLVAAIPRPDESHQRRSITYFTMFFLLVFVSFGTFSLRGAIGLYLSVVLTNVAAVAAHYFLYAGYSEHYAISFNVLKKRVVLINLVGIAVVQLLLTAYGNMGIRVVLLCTNLAILCAASCFIIFKNKSADNPGDTISLCAVSFSLMTITVAIPSAFFLASTVGSYERFLTIIFLLSEVGILGGIVTAYLYDLVRRYYRESVTDAMTGVHNRRYFYQHSRAILSAAERHNFPLCLVICDIDNFKYVNDTYGHDAGDKVIVEFAKMLEENLRGEDLMARFGGEEFVLLLPRASLEQAGVAVERMRRQTQKMNVSSMRGEVQFTASFGVAEITERIPLDLAIQMADDALYRAKDLGRDRVELEPREEQAIIRSARVLEMVDKKRLPVEPEEDFPPAKIRHL